MQSQTLKVVRIGNSRGVRLPAPLLSHYRIGHAVIAEHTAEGILLRPKHDGRLSWDDTFRATGTEQRKRGDEFADMDATNGDGLASLER
ncbi:MAG: AbrB/MazE/SpoVT family DNA-binding domain-containing protein [Opitutaceae bacterium]|nr:AbrB/MazE/SpoVT family DNA-binding domain-containing protein [Opitutaceae bacterium]